jgi:hypothetical protein
MLLLFCVYYILFVLFRQAFAAAPAWAVVLRPFRFWDYDNYQVRVMRVLQYL